MSSSKGSQHITSDTQGQENATRQEEDRGSAWLQETRTIPAEPRAISTQTSATMLISREKTSEVDNTKSVNQSSSSCDYLDQKKSSTFWSLEEDPAPQWLIEEALNRGSEMCKEYESLVSELEVKLTRAKADLEEALRTKSIVKEKYKRTLENVRAEAHRENEVLQERIVRICTSVLENFGPRAITEKRKTNFQSRSHRRLRCHERVSNNLHKKIRVTMAKSSKLKRELSASKKALRDETVKYDTMSKCFKRLKLEMETTEINLNNLMAENVSLRNKIEETRQWIELKVGKEHHERSNAAQFRDMQKSRELTNLKKKAEEDFATIAQLRNKLLRSESANANKGFLLNSYKSQLTELNKEKDQLLAKINGLENDINGIRNNNAQLKTKISHLNNEKAKLISETEKSKTDITEKAENVCAKKYEESMHREIDSVKAKYDEMMKIMKIKMNTIENQNSEYANGIKELLKKIHDHYEDTEAGNDLTGSEASEREAHETACSILNMTPEELSGLIKGKSQNSINSWLTEFSKITSKTNFSESLSHFLYKKAAKKPLKRDKFEDHLCT